MLDLSTNQDVLQQIPLFSGVVYALVNVIRRFSKRVDGAWVLLVAFLLAVFFGTLIAMTLFAGVRDWVYGVMSLFLAALGIDASRDKRGSPSDDSE